EIERAISRKAAVLALTHANYRTSEVFDMARLNRAARKHGVFTVWDLSHSAGAMPVNLNGTKADFAVGCGYKYLNGGPGGPGYLFIAKRHQKKVAPALPGWMGHARPFDFSGRFIPARGIQSQLTGTPYVYGLVALDAALDAFQGVDFKALYAKAGLLGDIFLVLALTGGAKFGLRPACPLERVRRGSQVTLRHPQGYAVMQALIASGVVGDFRPPDILRFGMTPLYTSYEDVFRAAGRLVDILAARTYRTRRWQARKRVT
ncbi:MAG TPA: aminotransferase class V-fold PLP-dependent enzyme, partial [Sphingomonadales bacterium]|nr:aminotransferase class V-fold PLP-dependent enzyme [Sphingomonadales bacterium]